MTYRDPSPPVPRPRRLCEVGETVAPTAEARRIHREVWGQTPCTPDEALRMGPYVPLPARGIVESVESRAPVRLLSVRWEDGTVSPWDDDSLHPLAGR